jgi:hypothetical protein
MEFPFGSTDLISWRRRRWHPVCVELNLNRMTYASQHLFDIGLIVAIWKADYRRIVEIEMRWKISGASISPTTHSQAQGVYRHRASNISRVTFSSIKWIAIVNVASSRPPIYDPLSTCRALFQLCIAHHCISAINRSVCSPLLLIFIAELLFS